MEGAIYMDTNISKAMYSAWQYCVIGKGLRGMYKLVGVSHMGKAVYVEVDGVYMCGTAYDGIVIHTYDDTYDTYIHMMVL